MEDPLVIKFVSPSAGCLYSIDIHNNPTGILDIPALQHKEHQTMIAEDNNIHTLDFFDLDRGHKEIQLCVIDFVFNDSCVSFYLYHPMSL